MSITEIETLFFNAIYSGVFLGFFIGALLVFFSRK